MNNLLRGLQTGTSKTLNGATTNQSTLNKCLDFFFVAGASRNMGYKELTGLFTKAYREDKHTALKILFWLRDVRGGAGERQTFRTLLTYMSKEIPEVYQDIIEFIPVYGRWDDLFFDMNIANHSIDYIKKVLSNIDNYGDLGLLFKWLPREKSSNKEIAMFIRSRLDINPKEYRKLLSNFSSTVENQMCKNEWEGINFKKVPSKAFNIYSTAFGRHDEKRFTSFLEEVTAGKTTINAGAIFPVDIYKSWQSSHDSSAINAQWSQLPDYMNDENIMAVCDTSGSMNGEPMAVSISLGVYISERSKGKFKDHFITFEGKPRLQALLGTATERFQQVYQSGSDCSTNLQGVFELILAIAKRDKLPQSELPTKLLILSDMEFNEATRENNRMNIPTTNFNTINYMYKKAGYERPALIFWNLNGRMDNYPIQSQDKNTALISGYSPAILKSILGGKELTPMTTMTDTLEKYSFIDKI